MAGTAMVGLITTVTKVAFFGFGVGYAPLDYTGISGHAMFAAAVLPVLAGLVVGGSTPRRRLAAIGVGYLLAVLIAYSRLRVGAHSLSEALTGLMLGSLASALALNAQRLPDIRPPPAVAGRGHAAVDAEPASERATILHA
jgi:membrane-associated phospholipid phosphatase